MKIIVTLYLPDIGKEITNKTFNDVESVSNFISLIRRQIICDISLEIV